MTCLPCQADPRPAHSDPRVCAFPDEAFRSDNWNCGTMNLLRDLSAPEDGHYSNEQRCGVVPVPEWTMWEDDEPRFDFVVLGWYKRRGRTEAAWVMDETKMRPLTLGNALKLLSEVERRRAETP